jgi:DNA-binding MarR family transcriptional regulator
MKDKNILKDIKEIDRVIHEPARLAIMAVLYGVEEADFKYLLTTTGLSRGNLSAHVAKLEEAGYVNVVKKFIGKKPATIYSMTERGREAFKSYLKLIGRLSSELER